MSRKALETDEVRKALALVRRLSRSGAALWDGISHSADFSVPEQEIDALLAPVDAAKTLEAVLAPKAEPGQHTRTQRARAPQAKPSLGSNRARPPQFPETSLQDQRKIFEELGSVPKRGGVPKLVSSHPEQPHVPATVTHPLPQATQTPRAAETEARAPHSLSDVAQLRAAQKRKAMRAPQLPDVPVTPTQVTANSGPKTTTHGDRPEFASLQEFSRDRLTHSQFEQVDNMTKKPTDLPQSPFLSTISQKPEAHGVTAISNASPLGFAEPPAARNVSELQFSTLDPRLANSTQSWTPAETTVDLLGADPSARRKPVVPPTSASKPSADLKLSRDVDDLGEAAWRNGVKPE